MKNHNLSREKNASKTNVPSLSQNKTTKFYAFLWMLDLEL